jgi:hypothetical protein
MPLQSIDPLERFLKPCWLLIRTRLYWLGRNPWRALRNRDSPLQHPPNHTGNNYP